MIERMAIIEGREKSTKPRGVFVDDEAGWVGGLEKQLGRRGVSRVCVFACNLVRTADSNRSAVMNGGRGGVMQRGSRGAACAKIRRAPPRGTHTSAKARQGWVHRRGCSSPCRKLQGQRLREKERERGSAGCREKKRLVRLRSVRLDFLRWAPGEQGAESTSPLPILSLSFPALPCIPIPIHVCLSASCRHCDL